MKMPTLINNEKIGESLQYRTTLSMNVSGTNRRIDTSLTQLRSLSDLRSFLHSYRIRAPDDKPRSARASTIIAGIDAILNESPTADRSYLIMLDMHRAARELAGLDPSLSWLPDWKPRVAVKGVS